MRVPGGWLYKVSLHPPVFVPLTRDLRQGEKLEISKRNHRKVVKEIIETVLEYYSLTEDELYEKTRRKYIVNARYQIIYFISKTLKLYSLNDMGAVFGLSHATVLHALKTVNNAIEVYPSYRQQIKEIGVLIKNSIKDESTIKEA